MNEANYEKAIADIKKMPYFEKGDHTIYLRIANKEEASRLVNDLYTRWNCRNGETHSLRLDKDTIYKCVGFYSQKDSSINFHYLNNQIDWINADTIEDHIGVCIAISKDENTYSKYYTAREVLNFLEKNEKMAI